MQVLGDFARALAFTNQLEDFELAIGEALDRRTARLGAPAGKDFEDLARTFFR